MSLVSETCRAIEFFKNNAGLCISPGETEEQARERGAVALAAAELWARNEGYSFNWCEDDVDSSEWLEPTKKEPAYTQWLLIMYGPDGHVASSLGCIDFGRDRDPWMDPQRRVFEAELALEQMGEET